VAWQRAKVKRIVLPILLVAVGTIAAAAWLGAGGSGQAGPPLLTARELAPYRQEISQGLGTITWTEGTNAASVGLRPLRSAQDTAVASFRDALPKLGSVDFAVLSLPEFVTDTTKLPIQGTMSAGDVWLDAVGADANGQSYELYAWRGPEFPQQASRPQVHRFVQMYALFNRTTGKVERLLVTIAGEAIE
jgi:hypothetical protein